MQARAKWAALSVVAVLGLGGWWYTQQTALGERGGQAGGGDTARGWSLMGAGKDAPPTSADNASAASRLTPEQVRLRLYKDGSLAGTEPAGEWCVDQGETLKPCHGLRSRFESYLLGTGEVGIDDLRGFIEDEARRAHGERLAAEIMAIFDKYWRIRTYDWKNQFVQSDRSTWIPVFEEQKAVRRQILGQPWAEAFFRDEEAQFMAYFAQLESGQPPPPDPGEPVPQMEPGRDPAAVRAERVARYGEEAAARLDQVDAQWADWERRLALARTEWARIQAANHLSDAQKKDEMARYVSEHFQGKETIRVKALLRY